MGNLSLSLQSEDLSPVGHLRHNDINGGEALFVGASDATDQTDHPRTFSAAVEHCDLSGFELKVSHISEMDVPRRSGRFGAVTTLCLTDSFVKVINCATLNILQALVKLDISHNSVDSIEGSLDLHHLTWVDLSYNNLADISSLVLWTTVRHLNLSYNRICDPSGLPLSLESLNISNNIISSTLSLRIIAISKDISILDLSCNPILERVSTWRARLVSLMPRLSGAS